MTQTGSAYYLSLPGNAPQYAPENVTPLENSPLAGKHLIFLGSSVTRGACALRNSFADYIAARDRCTVTKEAVSGTTLADGGPDSYVARMKRLEDPRADLFICQLSTNDARLGKPLGEIADGFEEKAFDTGTVAGAIEFIIAYARRRWRCPVVFYTCPRAADGYAAMVALLHRIAAKWGVPVIDMWSDEAFRTLSEEQIALYMVDDVHPSRAGHLEWLTPYVEQALYRI
ncbi:MAG: SGNH/GDSL hydrolase family protein [Lachnospiraceae bacterium]|nr:SGNH/GDSL hydrolase family protein [Lachnospiraceae bacterium]